MTRARRTSGPLSGAVLAAGVVCAAALAAPQASATPSDDAGADAGGAVASSGVAGPSAYAGTTRQAREANAAIAKLAASAEKAAKKIAKDAWVLPLSGGYRLTARFGQCSGLWSHCHTGLDMAIGTGATIRAVAAGTITSVGWAGAYGNRTVETLKDGTEIWYCHQSSIGVKVGDTVIGGQPIGAVGATGNVTGPHLHVEVRPGAGDPVDPYQAFVFHGITP